MSEARKTHTANPSGPAETRAAQSLAGIRFFEPLEPEKVRALEQKCSWRRATGGDEIFNRDTESHDVFFVTAGKVRVVNYSLSGREVAYATAEAGDYFGELSALDGQPRSASVFALEDCVLAALPAEDFRQLLLEAPPLALSVSEKLASIVRACNERIMDLATLSAYQRVYRQLLDLMRPDPVRPESWLIYPLPTQAQIASRASTTRETVARVLSQLAQAGIADRKSKTLYVRDVTRLREMAKRLSMQDDRSES